MITYVDNVKDVKEYNKMYEGVGWGKRDEELQNINEHINQLDEEMNNTKNILIEDMTLDVSNSSNSSVFLLNHSSNITFKNCNLKFLKLNS